MNQEDVGLLELPKFGYRFVGNSYSGRFSLLVYLERLCLPDCIGLNEIRRKADERLMERLIELESGELQRVTLSLNTVQMYTLKSLLKFEFWTQSANHREAEPFPSVQCWTSSPIWKFQRVAGEKKCEKQQNLGRNSSFSGKTFHMSVNIERIMSTMQFKIEKTIRRSKRRV